jgi:CRISPR system Cascade subunit CasE
MYHSHLLINVGDNPDRQDWRNRNWLRNLYRVHQRLCMAFPSDSRRKNDPQFLAPYRPDDFPEQRHLADQPAHAVDRAVLNDVHAPRGVRQGFLFRIDPQSGGRVVILVQSAAKPDWGYAFQNADYLLAAPPGLKSFDPCFAKGERLRFRLLANPTRKIDTKSGADGHRRHGRRVPVPIDQLDEWLDHRAGPAGFSIIKDSVAIQPAYIYVNKPWNGAPCHRCGGRMKENGQGEEVVCEQCGVRVRLLRHRLRSVRYEGILEVTDPARFRETLVRGIGPGKAFGFGLLSVAPINPSLLAEAR